MKAAGGKLAELKILVTAETARNIDMLIAERGWDPVEGLRILLGLGMAAARTEPASDGNKEGVERMGNRLKEVESSLAVLRFRMFEMQKANQSWELSTGAIRNQNLVFQGVIARQKEELEKLNRLLREKEEELAPLHTQVEQAQAPYCFELAVARHKKSWFSWLRRKA
jgi:hypothetical protein